MAEGTWRVHVRTRGICTVDHRRRVHGRREVPVHLTGMYPATGNSFDAWIVKLDGCRNDRMAKNLWGNRQ